MGGIYLIQDGGGLVEMSEMAYDSEEGPTSDELEQDRRMGIQCRYGPPRPASRARGNGPRPGPGGGKPPVIPPPVERVTKLRLRVGDLGIGKTTNLQPYLFRVIQEQDPGAELDITIDVSSAAGVSTEVLEQRIVQAFDQLGITVTWEERISAPPERLPPS